MTLYRGIEIDEEGVFLESYQGVIDYIYDTYEERLQGAINDNRVFNETTHEWDDVPLTEDQLKAFHVSLLMSFNHMGQGSPHWRFLKLVFEGYAG